MQKLFGRLRFEVKVGEKNLHQHQAFKFKFPENHEKYEGRSKTQQANSASQADYPQQLVLSFSDYDEIMMYLIID